MDSGPLGLAGRFGFQSSNPGPVMLDPMTWRCSSTWCVPAASRRPPGHFLESRQALCTRLGCSEAESPTHPAATIFVIANSMKTLTARGS